MPKSAVVKGVYEADFSKRDQADAKRIVRLMAKAGSDSRRSEYEFVFEGEPVTVSSQVKDLIVGALTVAAQGKKSTVTSHDAELRTQQAADILNVSRQYVVRLCDEGRLPFRWQGSHRRLAVADVMAYKANYDRERQEKFKDLIAMSAEAGLYEVDWPDSAER